MKLKDKAYNLVILKKNLKKKVIIPKFIFFSVKQFNSNEQSILKKIKIEFKNMNLIFRSSAQNEDGKVISNAGMYDSLIVKKNLQEIEILSKLKKYIKQFKSLDDRIIVQEFIYHQ